MYKIEILYPIKSLFGEKTIKEFTSRKNHLAKIKLKDIICALDSISEYWVSNDFLKKKEFKENSLGFIIQWLKKNNSEKLLNQNFNNYRALDEPIKNSINKTYLYARPNGIVLHWMTGNVPVITLISLFQGILTKNKNIVKVSSNYKYLFEIIFKDLKKNIPKKFKKILNKILKSILIIYIDHNDKISMEWLSKKADTRIIWGGKEAVTNILSLPKKINCKDIVFGPKVSLSYISKNKITNFQDLKNFSELFANDVFNFDQLGCNSPHNLFIEKGSFFSKEQIILELKKHFNYKLKLIKINYDPVSKYNFLVKRFKYQINKNYKIINDPGLNWNLFINTGKNLRVEEPLYNRTIFISEIKNYTKLKKILPNNIQSVGLYVTEAEKKKIILSLSENGVDRFPDIGNMSLYGHPWDGYFPMQQLVRWISNS